MATVKKSKKGKIITIVCIVLAAVIAVGAVVGVTAANRVPQVTLAEIGTDNIVEDINATGTVSSGAVKEYSAATVAQCKEVFVKAGDKVKKGDTLATFNTEDLDKQISSLQVSYNESYSSYKAAQKSQKENKKKLDSVNNQIKPLEKRLNELNKNSASASATKTNSVKSSGKSSVKNDSVTDELSDLIDAISKISDTIITLSDDITTTNAITRQVMNSIAAELEKGTYSPEKIAQAAGDAMSEAIKKGLIDETQLILESGVAVEAVEKAVMAVDWEGIGTSIVTSDNVTLASTELQLASLYAQKEIFALGASTSTLNAQKQAVKTTKQALDALKKSEQELSAGWISTIDGVVTECNVEEGVQTSALQTGIKIENLNDLVVTISLGEYDVHKVSTGMKATITTAYGEYTGEIASIAPTATGGSSGSILDNVGSMAGISGLSSLTDKGAGVECIVTVDQPDNNIIAGFEANVQIQTGTYSNVPTIPIESLVLEKEGSYVYKYNEDEGTVTKTKIEVGAHSDFAYEIKSGLKIGDKIVATPGQDYTEETFKVKVK